MERLYKARKRNSKEWVEGIPYDNYMICGMDLLFGDDEIPMSEHPEFDYIEIEPNTISAYIGRKDKNGNKIFENDVIKTKYGRKCAVVWFSSPSYCGWDLKPIESNYLAPDPYDMWYESNLEVIGNMFDGFEKEMF